MVNELIGRKMKQFKSNNSNTFGNDLIRHH